VRFAKLPTHFEFSKNALTFQHAAAQEVGVDAARGSVFVECTGLMGFWSLVSI